jgi:uncharacterized protein (TIGR03435 family)
MVKALVGGLALFSMLAGAQPGGAARPRFEVASVKPCGNTPPPASQQESPGRLSIRCAPLRTLIQRAYVTYANGSVSSESVLAGMTMRAEKAPDWIMDRYEIEARADGAASEGLMNGPMLQALLEERFALRIHRETREAPIYVLTAAKGGHKMKAFVEGTCIVADITQPAAARQPGQNYCRTAQRAQPPNFVVDAQGVTMEEFSKTTLASMDRPVVNQTGIAGRYDFHLEFAPDESIGGVFGAQGLQRMRNAAPRDAAAPDSIGASIFTALQQQLGLRLEPARGPSDFLVIDHVERPSAN